MFWVWNISDSDRFVCSVPACRRCGVWAGLRAPGVCPGSSVSVVVCALRGPVAPAVGVALPCLLPWWRRVWCPGLTDGINRHRSVSWRLIRVCPRDPELAEIAIQVPGISGKRRASGQNLLHHFLERERVGQVYLDGDNAFIPMHTCAHCMAQRLAAAAYAHPQLKGS